MQHSVSRLWPHKRFLASVVLFLFALGISGLSQRTKTRSSAQKSADKVLEESFNIIQNDPRSWAESLLESQQALAKFGYGTLFTARLDDRTKDALRQYQAHSGLPVTGDLDFATWMRVQKDEMSMARSIPMGPSYIFNDSDWDNILSAQGIWLEQGQEPEPSTPVRAARIECFKSSKQCIAVTHGETLISIQYLDVERWDKFEIETRPDDLPCGREHIEINRSQKSILTVNTAAYKNDEACTKLFGPPGKPVVSYLADAAALRDVISKSYLEAHDQILLIPADAKERAGLVKH